MGSQYTVETTAYFSNKNRHEIGVDDCKQYEFSANVLIWLRL